MDYLRQKYLDTLWQGDKTKLVKNNILVTGSKNFGRPEGSDIGLTGLGVTGIDRVALYPSDIHRGPLGPRRRFRN